MEGAGRGWSGGGHTPFLGDDAVRLCGTGSRVQRERRPQSHQRQDPGRHAGGHPVCEDGAGVGADVAAANLLHHGTCELRAAHRPGDPRHQGQGGQKETRFLAPLVAHPAPQGIADHGEKDRRRGAEDQERREDRAGDVEGPSREGGTPSVNHPPARSSG